MPGWIYEIYEPEQLDSPLENELIEIWDKALRVSHAFFSDCDAEIRFKKPRVRADLHRLILICARIGNEIKGFAGIADKELKMLYTHPDWQGRGIGRSLVEHAIEKYRIKYVDVYEQNTQAVGFYEHIGFVCYETSSKPDSKGKVLPILRMELLEEQ